MNLNMHCAQLDGCRTKGDMQLMCALAYSVYASLVYFTILGFGCVSLRFLIVYYLNVCFHNHKMRSSLQVRFNVKAKGLNDLVNHVVLDKQLPSTCVCLRCVSCGNILLFKLRDLVYRLCKLIFSMYRDFTSCLFINKILILYLRIPFHIQDDILL